MYKQQRNKTTQVTRLHRKKYFSCVHGKKNTGLLARIHSLSYLKLKIQDSITKRIVFTVPCSSVFFSDIETFAVR